LKDSGRTLKLSSYDDIFSTDESRQDETREKVQEIPLEELHPFKDHPFKVTDDERMQETAESIKKFGVLVPAIARPFEEGGYELIAGHRRKRACEMAGLSTMPVIIRDLDDAAATIIMVDSNLQRENILPSERAFAYSMKMEALKHQGERDGTSRQVGEKSWAVSQISADAGESERQVHRYIRLTQLIPPLLDRVDEKTIALGPAVEISYLTPEEQFYLLQAIEICQSTPSLSQAQRMKKFSQEGRLSKDMLEAILSEEKKPPEDRIVLKSDRLHKYFPKSYSTEKMEKVIITLLEAWQKRRQQNQEH